MSKKLKSGIIGHAQVLFGDAININLGTSQNAESETMAIGMTELGYKKAKDDDYQVVLVFPNLKALNKFRNILDRLEAEQKKHTAQRKSNKHHQNIRKKGRTTMKRTKTLYFDNFADCIELHRSDRTIKNELANNKGNAIGAFMAILVNEVDNLRNGESLSVTITKE